MRDSEEVMGSKDLVGKLREGPTGTESSRDQDDFPPAVLGKESSSPCSKPQCCHYRGVLDVAKEGAERKKMA